MADGAILGDGGLRRRSMLGWEEAEVSIGLVEFKAPLGYPQGGALPALDTWAMESEGSLTSKQEGPRVWP